MKNCCYEIVYTTVFQKFYKNSSKLIKYNKKLAKNWSAAKPTLLHATAREYIKSTLLHASTYHSMQNTCINIPQHAEYMQQHEESFKSTL